MPTSHLTGRHRTDSCRERRGRSPDQGWGLPVLVLRRELRRVHPRPELASGMHTWPCFPCRFPLIHAVQSCMAVWLLPAGWAPEAAGQSTDAVPDGAGEGTAAGQNWALGERYCLSFGASVLRTLRAQSC